MKKTFFLHFFYTPVSLIFWIFNIKFPNIIIDRIGHLICESDCYIKFHLIKKVKLPTTILLINKPSANNTYLEYLKKYFIIIKNPILVKLLLPFLNEPLCVFNTRKFVAESNITAKYYQIQSEWGSNPPLFSLTNNDLIKGYSILSKMGLSKNSKFVCIHSRSHTYSPKDNFLHSYRNTPISDYNLAAEYLIKNNIQCIRMGDAAAESIEPIPGYIDYAKSAFRSDFMDIFLSANCLFFLGSNSGAFHMASVFGKSVAIANNAPITVAPTTYLDTYLFMLYKQYGNILSLNEIFNSSFANFRLSGDFEMNEILLVRNTPEEILQLAKEQLYKVNHKFSITQQDLYFQNKFRSFFKNGDYSYKCDAHVSYKFLENHKYLFE